MRLIVISLVVLASCGRNDTPSQQAPKPVEETGAPTHSPKTVPSGQPRYLMIKVPLDAEGKEVVSAAEARQIADGANMTNAEDAMKAFDAAKPVVLVEELDQSTSTESWGWYPGKLLGRGSWWGVNPYLYYNNNFYPYTYGQQFLGYGNGYGNGFGNGFGNGNGNGNGFGYGFNCYSYYNY